MKRLNERIEAINKEKTKAELSKEMLMRQLNEKLAKYKETYGVDLSSENFATLRNAVKRESERVSSDIQKEYELKTRVVNAIEAGNISEANTLLGIVEEPEEVVEEPSAASIEISDDIDIGEMDISTDSAATAKPKGLSFEGNIPDDSDDSDDFGMDDVEEEPVVDKVVEEKPSKSIKSEVTQAKPSSSDEEEDEDWSFYDDDTSDADSDVDISDDMFGDSDEEEDSEEEDSEEEDFGDFSFDDDDEGDSSSDDSSKDDSDGDDSSDDFGDFSFDDDDDDDDFGFGGMLKGTKFE